MECSVGPDCLARRTVTVRDGAPVVGLETSRLPVFVEAVRRDGAVLSSPHDAAVRAGDELVLFGTAEAFAQAAPLFRTGSLDDVAMAQALADTRTMIDTDRVVTLVPAAGAACDHLDQIRPVTPSARGCEDCIRIGARWVHLRICMTCGHVGCCDSSPHKHATAHHRTVGHPIIKSGEPGEDWGWCYPDEVML